MFSLKKMASNDNGFLFQCSHCKNELDMKSKSFPCLHSFCETCLNKEVKGETSGSGQCSQCNEMVKIDQLTLSPILLSYLKCRKLESTEWKCDICLEDRNESTATSWCEYCEKFLCPKCNLFHQKFHKQHSVIELSGIGKKELREAMRTDMCNVHHEIQNSYCHRCNMCFCDTCYSKHLKDSDDCSSRPVSVKEEALKKQKSQGPTLLQEIQHLENDLLERNIKSRSYSELLEKECNSKCEELWQNNDSLIEELKEKTHEMCDELRRITKEQVKKWQKFLQETERMLKKLEIWRLNLQHLLKKGPKEKDIVLGVELVARNLESSSPDFHRKIKEPLTEWQLQMEFSHYWQQFLKKLQNEMIGLGSLYSSDNFLQFENEWNLPRSNTRRWITSVVVSDKDYHIFLADYSNGSIIELKESGEFVNEVILKDDKGKTFPASGLFFNSSEILGVNCVSGEEEKLFFFEREKCSPFLKINKIINKKKQNFSSFSVCKIKKTILFCDKRKFQFDFYTEKGDYIKTIDTQELGDKFPPLIRADPSTGSFWGTIPFTNKICCFKESGQKLQTFEMQEEICDFSVNKFGQIFFCNKEGIFVFFPEKKCHKIQLKFQNESESRPKIFVSNEKIFVCLEVDEKYLIKIFKLRE